MTLTFHNEEIFIKGAPVLCNIEVQATTTDASFSHEFGTEIVEDVEFAWTTFEHVSGGKLGELLDYLKSALDSWLTNNEARIAERFDKLRRS